MDFRSQQNLLPGLRNNNPGNIKTGQGWKGVVGNDGTFDIFSDDTWGLRALAMDLTAKMNRGLNTIASIISAYAPPGDNDTPSYISAVSRDTGIDPNELVQSPNDLPALMRAIVSHENGDQGSLISDADISQGIAMMGNGPGVLVQSAVDAVVNNTDNAGVILGGGVVLLLILLFRKGK